VARRFGFAEGVRVMGGNWKKVVSWLVNPQLARL